MNYQAKGGDSMKNDVKRLAARYIDETIEDQRKLGYTGRVPEVVRADAERHAEQALVDLARSARRGVRAAAA